MLMMKMIQMLEVEQQIWNLNESLQLIVLLVARSIQIIRSKQISSNNHSRISSNIYPIEFLQSCEYYHDLFSMNLISK